jgi:hypothetical protein
MTGSNQLMREEASIVFVNLDQHAPPRSVDTCLVIIITRKLLIYGTKTRVVRDIFNCHASHSKD